MYVRGNCQILYCLDLAREIDLVAAQQRLGTWQRVSFNHKSRVLTGDAVLPPLRVRFDAKVFSVGPWNTVPTVELALYDLGTLCVTWRIPFDCPLEELVGLSANLYDNAPLLERSRELAVELLDSLGSAAQRPCLSDLVEDYFVFEVASLDGPIESLGTSERGTLARVLRAEPDELSAQEIEDSLSDFVAYRARETCYVDWLGAFLCGTNSEDERLVLELATVELLGLRLLDAQLDTEINDACDLTGRASTRSYSLSSQRRELQRVGSMQADGAVLHEGIDNALKLLGDDYLARLYRTAAERFHLNDWDASIERKLAVLRSVYQSLADFASHRRSETLEWIIIVLIGVEIALYFFPLH